ncbi:MAG TPA: molecular chaperone HtpG [Stellaceae bacterium]|nr:molecular chaperone HtpG [Stellaceae bacterium]
MTTEKREFQAEVSRLLEIVAHSLYSEKEIFLRELISNASDACDRLRYQALTEPQLIAGDANFRVVLEPDEKKRTLVVADNGIGMSRQEMIDNLGTIARSGTAQFMKQFSGDQKADLALIGQFGVGFYSAFMVAREVEVVSRKAGEAIAHRWVSDGKGQFTIEEAERAGRGTTITLHLNEADEQYTTPARLEAIVKKYSDHIALPIVLDHAGVEKTLNSASALWMRPKAEITAEQYNEFYHHVGHAFDEPWLTLHAKAEGVFEYTTLLFVPSGAPFDLFDPARKHRVKLYVRRIFITEDAQELLPPYLRFLRGIVDSEDLPLNVSREMLQNNPTLARMRGQIVKRVLGELAKKAKDDPQDYAKFWGNFGAVLKEGIYEDRESSDAILELARFRSTAGEGLVSLEDYAQRMKPGQEAIYTIAGDTIEVVAKSPQLEGFRARGIEVLYLTDPVDEFWTSAVGVYKKKEFKSVTRGAADLDKIAAADKKEDADDKPKGDVAALIAVLKLALGDAVKDVRASKRLTDSAVCLIADEHDMDIHLERLLRQHRQLAADSKRILEINPKHALIAQLLKLAGKDGAADALGDFAWILLDQARILEGEPLPDPAAFAKRLSAVLAKGLTA